MRIFWTESALAELNLVFEYYKKNVSLSIARRMKKSAIERVKILREHPKAGQIEESLEELGFGHRYLVEGNYKIIYRRLGRQIFITDFFDTRQDPDKLKNRAQK